EMKQGLKFLDVFAGSGVVSKLAKSLNFEVYTNDWENYSYILNNGFIKSNYRDINSLFGSSGEFIDYLDQINNIPAPSMEDKYISKYYAPESYNIDEADFRVERLFYTKENALTIDKIRNFIETEHPEGNDNRIRNILLSVLIYQSATHTNTSGVFKAFHKGFGGHGKDAMKRILTPIRLSMPNLIDSDYPVHIFKEDANILVKNKEVQNIDIAYLDPPYNQHQYGSNYHMLNTIALWDKISAPLTLNGNGVLTEKAAIRKDWINTRSNYCYSESAISSFKDLIDNLDAKFILISYSSDGLIPFETMKKICTSKGKLTIVTNEYTKYRGGKQSNNHQNVNIEFVLIIDTQNRSLKEHMIDIDSVIIRKKILLMFKQKYTLNKLKTHCERIEGDNIFIDFGGKTQKIVSKNHFELFPPENIDNLSMKENEILYKTLQNCVCKTKEEELEEIISKINGNIDNKVFYIKLIPNTLKKLAHKKNKDRFIYWLNIIKIIEKTDKDLYRLIDGKIEKLELLAEKRFNN
ncbi:MAG: hypothetical protein GY760_24880, partial [Deltaproteobacteria bacterium]|nr:hypothetical protein [Deltaproteobacteria bacterium]